MSLEQRKWSQEDTYNLISFYRELRVLWDPDNSDYGLKSKRAEAISALAEKFNTTDAEINRKIHNLRCQFRGEVRSYNRRNKLGVDQCVSNWQFFDVMKDMMGFSYEKELNYHSEAFFGMNSDPLQNIQSGELGSTSSEYSFNNILPSHAAEHSSHTFTPSTSKRKRKLTEIDSQPPNSTCRNLKPYDENQAFGVYVANELRHLRTENQRIAKLRITRILLETAEAEAQTRHLTE